MSLNDGADAPKLRPYLTLPQIEHIITLCMADSKHPESRGIIYALQMVSLKARAGITKPAYIPASTRISASLGMPAQSNLRDINTLLDQFAKNPLSLSLQELDQVTEYRYVQGMMNPEERDSYLVGLMNKLAVPIEQTTTGQTTVQEKNNGS